MSVDAATGVRGGPVPPPPALERLREAEERLIAGGLDDQPKLRETVEYMLASTGKQLRHGIAVETGRYGPRSGGDDVYRVAAAVELMHLGSLAHDDIVDDGAQRRGWDSVATRAGVCTAGLAASWVFTRALELVTYGGPEAIEAFTQAGMELCDGQMMDAEDVFDTDRSPERYFATIAGKTSSLFWLATSLGAIAAGAAPDVVAGLRRFGWQLGIVFQISDDVMDLCATEEILGKAPAADVRDGVYTLPVIYALEADPTLPPLLPQAAVDEEARRHVLDTVIGSGGVARALEDCARHAALAADELRGLGHRVPEAEQRLLAVLEYSHQRAVRIAG